MNKIIMHIDFNSYFASVEQQANPHLRGKAIAVAGKAGGDITRSVVTTASREAKARGVKTAMATWQAKKLCPELIIIPGDPQKYAEVTARFLIVCNKYADAVEQFSTDEVFIDVTTAADNYFGASMLALMIRRDLKAACSSVCTVSIGIAPNKLVAKLASESVKPNGLTVVRPHEVADFVKSRPLADFCGLGHSTEKRLAEIGVTSVETLRAVPRAKLINLFQSHGTWLADAAHGLATDILEDDNAAPKSIGHSYTFPHDLHTLPEIKKNLLAMCDRVAWRLRQQKMVALRLAVYVRYGNFGSDGCSKLLNTPISDGLTISQNAWALLSPHLNLTRGIRLISISVSEFRTIKLPTSLFRKDQKMQRVVNALDTVQTKFGTNAWHRASTVHTKFLERTSGWHYDHLAMANKS
jgi:DNA polymerase-4